MTLAAADYCCSCAATIAVGAVVYLAEENRRYTRRPRRRRILEKDCCQNSARSMRDDADIGQGRSARRAKSA